MLDSASRKLAPRPIPRGWALDPILRLDEAHAGFLRFLHSASVLRRQGVFLALTQLNWDRVDEFASWIARSRERQDWRKADPLAVIASGLTSMRVREIVHAIFGAIPPGLLGALSRCGDEPLDVFSYTLLHAICDDPKNRSRRALLQKAPKIDDNMIDVVWRLPKALPTPDVLTQIKTSATITTW